MWNIFSCCVSSFYFSVLPLSSEVHLSTCGSRFKKQGSLWEGNADPPCELERECFEVTAGDSPALLFLPHLPVSAVKTTPSIRDLTMEIYEMGQKSQSYRSWDSALNCTTIPASPPRPSYRQQQCQTLMPLPAPLLHLLGAKHPFMPSKHSPAGEHLSCEKWAKSFQ